VTVNVCYSWLSTGDILLSIKDNIFFQIVSMVHDLDFSLLFYWVFCVPLIWTSLNLKLCGEWWFLEFCGVCLCCCTFKLGGWWCRSGKGGWILACQTLWRQPSVEVLEKVPLGKLKLQIKQTEQLLNRWVMVISSNVAPKWSLVILLIPFLQLLCK